VLAQQRAQLHQRPDRDGGRVPLTQRAAANRIEHPRRHGSLRGVGELDDDRRLASLMKGPNDRDRLAEQGMVSVVNLTRRQVMSSVLTPCA